MLRKLRYSRRLKPRINLAFGRKARAFGARTIGKGEACSERVSTLEENCAVSAAHSREVGAGQDQPKGIAKTKASNRNPITRISANQVSCSHEGFSQVNSVCKGEMKENSAVNSAMKNGNNGSGEVKSSHESPRLKTDIKDNAGARKSQPKAAGRWFDFKSSFKAFETRTKKFSQDVSSIAKFSRSQLMASLLVLKALWWVFLPGLILVSAGFLVFLAPQAVIIALSSVLVVGGLFFTVLAIKAVKVLKKVNEVSQQFRASVILHDVSGQNRRSNPVDPTTHTEGLPKKIILH